MAKLKITDAVTGNILPQGYVNVANNLAADQGNLDIFAGTPAKQRPTLLQGYADDPAHPGTYVVKQETAFPAPNDLEPIDNTNCQIKGEKDQKHDSNHRSTVTVPLPVEAVADFSYLDEYASTIVRLYASDRQYCYR